MMPNTKMSSGHEMWMRAQEAPVPKGGVRVEDFLGGRKDYFIDKDGTIWGCDRDGDRPMTFNECYSLQGFLDHLDVEEENIRKLRMWIASHTAPEGGIAISA